MSAATAAMMAWLKAAATPRVTPPPVTPVTPEHGAWCNRPQTGVFIGETPSKTGPVTPVTPVTPQKQGGEVKTPETAPPTLPSVEPTPAPAKAGAWYRIDAPWRVASKAWQAHRATCPTCMAADRTQRGPGTGQRCQQGQALYEADEATPRD